MQLHIQDYHSWFKGLVGDWIDVAAIKCKDEIKRAVTSVDEVSCALLLICVSIETSQSSYRLSLSLRMSGFLNLL